MSDDNKKALPYAGYKVTKKYQYETFLPGGNKKTPATGVLFITLLSTLGWKDLEEFNFEDQDGVGFDHASRTSAIAQSGRNKQFVF